MTDRNSRDAVIIIMTADAVHLRATARLCKFSQRRNLQHTRRTRSASEITTLPGIIVICERRQLGAFGERGLIAESVFFQTRQVSGPSVVAWTVHEDARARSFWLIKERPTLKRRRSCDEAVPARLLASLFDRCGVGAHGMSPASLSSARPWMNLRS